MIVICLEETERLTELETSLILYYKSNQRVGRFQNCTSTKGWFQSKGGYMFGAKTTIAPPVSPHEQESQSPYVINIIFTL